MIPALRVSLLVCAAGSLLAQSYSAPAGIRPPARRPGAAGILPGGRIIAPLGEQFPTGAGPFGIAVSPSGRTAVTANGGPERFSLTVMRRERQGPMAITNLLAERRGKNEAGEEGEWRSVFMGLAFANERTVYISDGNSGRVRLMDLESGSKRSWDLNQGGYSDSYTGALALDAARGILYVVDQANFRLVALDISHHTVLSSVRLGRLPFAIALSPDRRTAWVTNVGMFEYKALPGSDSKLARETGIPFPAFGFPSKESASGTTSASEKGKVDVAPLGDPNVRESNSVCAIDISDPAAMKVTAFIRTGIAFGEGIDGGSSPSGIVATAERVYVSSAHNDSIAVIDARSYKLEREIPLRIPGFEKLRGVLPVGLAIHAERQWLLVAEAGINAIGIIELRSGAVLGHLPAAWFPTAIAVTGDSVWVANARGIGAGPNHERNEIANDPLGRVWRRGAAQVFPLPAAAELARHTRAVMEANGFVARPEPEAKMPSAIRYVVLIVKENRTFDEVFGDLAAARPGTVMGEPPMARFGQDGYVPGDGQRLSLHHINVTPNHHALADRGMIGDNFHADSDVSVDGHHWLVGAYPNAWTESTLMAAYGGQKDFRFPTTAPGRLNFPGSNSSVHPEEQPEAGTLWHHLQRHGIPFRNFGEGFELAGVDEGPGLKPTGARFITNVPMPQPLFANTSRQYPGFNMNIPDQFRAAQFIAEMEARYVKTGAEIPRFIYIHLPNDHMAKARPGDGYPYEASYVADNDYALGRIVEFLSRTKWWKQMAVFVTEDDAQGGRDHIDAHRTVLIGASPYFKRGCVSHVNTSFPGLLKTVFRLFGLPPLNLFDAAATPLTDCFTTKPDFTPYRVIEEDKRLFDPAKARDPLDPATPSPRMDDPEEIRRQQRK